MARIVRSSSAAGGTSTKFSDAFATDQLSLYTFLSGSAANLAISSEELTDSQSSGAVIFSPPNVPATYTDTYGVIKFKWVTANTGNVGIGLKALDSDDILLCASSISTPNLQIICLDAGVSNVKATTAPAAYTENTYYYLAAWVKGNMVECQLWDANQKRLTSVQHDLAAADATKFGSGVAARPYVRLNSIANTSWKFDDIVLGKNPFIP